ncbi:MAG: hypothetical protein R3F20_08575 [Planctomycetota bacterium]
MTLQMMARFSLLVLVTSACRSAAEDDAGTYSDPYAANLIAATERGTEAARASDSVTPPETPGPRDDRWDEARALRAACLREVDASGDDLDALVRRAWRDHPDLLRARAELRAARARYGQVDWLDDVLRSVADQRRLGRTAGGPPLAATGSDRSLGPWPSVEALRGEIADQDLRMAFEELRAAALRRRAEILSRSAELRTLEARRVLTDRHVGLYRQIGEVLRARIAGGAPRQAEALAAEERLADLERQGEELDLRTADARAALAEAVGAPPTATFSLEHVMGFASAEGPTTVTGDEGRNAPVVEMARARRDRMAASLRLAETVVRVRSDVATARFERERSGEGGIARTPMLSTTGPRPGARAVALGPALALIEEARRRLTSAEAGIESRELDRARAEAAALADLHVAEGDLATLRGELLPRAREAETSLNASFARDRATYLDVVRAAERLIQIEEREQRVIRELARARARLIEAIGAPLAP